MSEPSPDQLDQQSMARLAGGDDGALNDLMARHSEPLYRYLLRLLQSETEAADLAEEAFVRVYQHRARFKPGARFSTWLYTIATNLVRDLQRFRSRHPQVSLDAEHPESGQSFGDILPAERPHPGESLEAAERVQLVQHAIAALPEDLRIPLVLAEYEEKSQAEIAQILECSAKAVEMRLYRARQQLRTKLGKLLGSEKQE